MGYTVCGLDLWITSLLIEAERRTERLMGVFTMRLDLLPPYLSSWHDTWDISISL